MSTTPITTALPGEQILQLSPSDANEAATTWLRRPNLFPGPRAHGADTRRPQPLGRRAHCPARQTFTPGVVNGLEVGYAVTPPSEGGAHAQVRVHISAGRGLAASGEDVWLARAIELDFYDLPVVAPPTVFEGGGGSTDEGETGALRARAIGPSLGELLTTNAAALPLAGVLVLQPAALDVSDIDPLDPCDRCGCAEDNVSYEDWRLADAVRLLWYVWPDEWRALPAAGPRFRNALAYTIFDAERSLDAGQTLPWEEFGVPIALIGVDTQYVPSFSDGPAVVRVGGRVRVSRLQLGTLAGGELTLAPRPRLSALWQAQIEQLAGQIADLGDPAPAASTLAQSFGRLPPCGLLPTNVFDLGTHSSSFFPGGFDLDAVPVPLEQLDLAVREAAPLAPLDFSLGERVRVLVPVSQASWEPRLLMTEVIDPLFQQTLDRYLLNRSRALGARQGLRIAEATLREAIDATAPAVPDIAQDPDALETESFGPWGPPPASSGHRATLMPGVHQHFFDSATAGLTPSAGESLFAWVYLDPDNPPQTLVLQWLSGTWDHRAYWGTNSIDWGTDGTASRLRMGDLPPVGEWVRLAVPADSVGLAGQSITGMAFTLFDGRAAYGSSGRLAGGTEIVWFGAALPAGAVQHGDYGWAFLTPNALSAPFEPSFGLANAPPGAAAPPPAGFSSVIQNLVASGALGALSTHEQGQLTVRGLKGFIDYLTSRTNRVDDMIDFGFVKVQTDVYRLRQLVLNTTAATRLAVSPTLAGIAEAETAVASQQQISTFFNDLKGAASTIGSKALPTAAASAIASTGDAAPAISSHALNVSIGGKVGGPSALGGIGAVSAKLDTGSAMLKLSGSQFANLQLDTGIGPIVKQPTYTPIDIGNANPLVGNVAIRTVSIAERLAQPKAQEARDYSSASRQDGVNRLLMLADTLRDEDRSEAGTPGETSGLFAGLQVFGAKDDPFLGSDATTKTARRRPFTDFLDVANRANLLSLMLQPPVHDFDPDESTHFSDATDTSDTTVALLRQIEGRVRLFRDAIAACQQALSTLQADYASAQASERAWGEKLAEARHDVAVTRALIAEEQARLDAVNARRAAVLAAEVHFLAYVRPRDADNLLRPPARNLDPGLIDPPVPACLRTHPDVPDELTGMLVVVRDAPAAWFGQGATWFDGLDHVAFWSKRCRPRSCARRSPPPCRLSACARQASRAQSPASRRSKVRP